MLHMVPNHIDGSRFPPLLHSCLLDDPHRRQGASPIPAGSSITRKPSRLNFVHDWTFVGLKTYCSTGQNAGAAQQS